MSAKPKWPWLPDARLRWAVAVVLLIAAASGFVRWREHRAFSDVPALLSRFPVEDAAVLRIDASALRAAGLLTEPRQALEPEYRQFLDGTGFDYRRDLESLVASFSPSGTYFIVRGHFDWNKLRAYAARQGGSCYQDLCRVQGSTPERRISFLPLRDDVMALAVSQDDLAASRLAKPSQPVAAKLPNAPVWLSIPGTELRRPGALPPGLRAAFSGLINADRIVITLNGAEAHLEASCRTPDDARILASQLRTAARTIGERASGDDVARALAAGSFDQSGLRVDGRWPVSKAMLDSLTSGI